MENIGPIPRKPSLLDLKKAELSLRAKIKRERAIEKQIAKNRKLANELYELTSRNLDDSCGLPPESGIY